MTAVSVRRLLERDKARDDGDTLARAVHEYLTGKLDREALEAALVRYREEQGLPPVTL
jgi:hypothetical protein